MSSTWKPRPVAHLFPAGQTLNVGHRGASGLAPENTMHAFREAQKAGAHAVEFDVMLSKDKKVIVFHDSTLQQRLFSEGKVRSMTYAELKKVDVSAYYTEHHPSTSIPTKFRPAHIPLLEEVLEFYKKYPKAVLNVELKNATLRGTGLEPAVAQLLRKHGYTRRVIVSSFNPFSVWRFRKAAPEMLRALIYYEGNPIYIRNLWFIDLAQPDALHPKHTMITPAYAAWAKQKGLALNPWTVNDVSEMKRLIRLGVTGIITDFPDRLNQVLRTQK